MHMTEVETHKARKAHRCEWCWQRIDEGAEYKRYRYYDGGDAATIKMHPECMEAMQEEAAYWGGDFEWTPGQERPKVGADETANVVEHIANIYAEGGIPGLWQAITAPL